MSEYMHMDRRSLLQSAFALVGASVALSACDFGSLGPKGTFVFDDKQRALISALCDSFVPKTDTAGAVEAGVPQAFEGLLSNWAKPETRDVFLAAMKKVDDAAQKAKGKSFADLSLDERIAVLKPMDDAGFTPDPEATKAAGLGAYYGGPVLMDPEYGRLKTMLVTLYYSSEAGLTEELTYSHNPGAYRPSVPVTPDTRPA